MFGLGPETLQLSHEAIDRLRELCASHPGAQGVCLHIAEGKGCSGNEYKMDVVASDADISQFDRIDYAQDATLFVPKKF